MPKRKTKRQPRAEMLPSGRWRCRVYDSAAKKQRAFIADTPEEAVMLASEWKLNRDVEQAAPMSLEKAIGEYIALKSNILSPSTVDGYRKAKNRIDSALLKKPVSRITPTDLQREVNRLAGVYSPKTVKNTHGLISAVMGQYAPKVSTAVTLPTVQKRVRELAEPLEVIKAVQGSDMELLALLAMWLSLRASEIRGLKKSDFKGDKVTINRVIVTVKGEDGKMHDIVKDAPKTAESRRVIQVPPMIRQMVEALPEGFITSRSGVSIYKGFKLRISRAGYPDMTFHDLRHVNASVMLMLGVPDKYAMERGGWATPSTLKRIYQETYTTEREKVDKMIDDYFEGLYASFNGSSHD